MPDTIKYYFFSFFIAILLLGLFILLLATLYSKKQQKNRREKLLMQTQFQQELLQTQLEIQEQTLKTISQEIHDNIGQVLSLAKLNLNTVNINDEVANKKIGDTKELVSKAINDLRDLSRSLHGDKIAELGLHESIANELKILENTGQFKTVLRTTSGSAYKLDQQKEMVLFRIFQEAINNIIKHAKANIITVEFDYKPSAFSMNIIDNGIGFKEAELRSTQTGIGLKSMRNRAAMIGAAFSCVSAPGNGTSIQLQLIK